MIASFKELYAASYAHAKGLYKTFLLGTIVLVLLQIATRFGGAVFFGLGSLLFQHSQSLIGGTFFVIGAAFYIATFVVQLVSTAFVVVLTVEGVKAVKPMLRRSFDLCVKVLLCGMWIILRTYSWVGFIGFLMLAASKTFEVQFVGVALIVLGMVLAFIFIPRLSFTTIVLVREKKGVLESAKLSMKYTEGYWGKIVGNYLLLAIIVFGISVGGFFVAALPAILGSMNTNAFSLSSIILFAVSGLLLFAFVFLMMFVTLWTRAFTVSLYETIKQHPKAVTSARS